MAHVRAVLWDVGNVIVRWDPRTLYAKIFDDVAKRDAFLGHICTPAWNLRHDAGRPIDEGVAELTAQHPDHALAIAAWRDRWWEMFSGPIEETCAAIEALNSAGVPQFGLTNMSAETAPGTFALSPVFAHLQDIIISGVERVVKPDPVIYQIACHRSGFSPQEILFVDDSAANIAGAQALGFAVHRFADPLALRPALEQHGLL